MQHFKDAWHRWGLLKRIVVGYILVGVLVGLPLGFFVTGPIDQRQSQPTAAPFSMATHIQSGIARLAASELSTIKVWPVPVCNQPRNTQAWEVCISEAAANDGLNQVYYVWKAAETAATAKTCIVRNWAGWEGLEAKHWSATCGSDVNGKYYETSFSYDEDTGELSVSRQRY